MGMLAGLGTCLPPWGSSRRRVTGPDEDALTLAVAAGRAALTAAGLLPADGSPPPAEQTAVRQVVFVTRQPPLLVGGSGAVLLAGIGLASDIAVVEQLGGAPAVLDALTSAAPGTLVVAADAPDGGEPAGAAAALVGTDGVPVEPAGRVVRSLPVRSRALGEPVVRDYADPRLERERGVMESVARLEPADKPRVVAGLDHRLAATLCTGEAPMLPTRGASSALFAVAALADGASPGVVLAVEQASVTAVRVVDVPSAVHRDEPAPLPAERLSSTPGPDIAVSLAAYERAFEAKLRWEAGRCDACGELALPPRYRCLGCGSEAGWTLVPLPRTGEIHSVATVRVPVPGVPVPYSLALVDLDGKHGVRALVRVTGAPAGSTAIGARGRLVLRRLAVRSGIPDYGHAFFPDPPTGRANGTAPTPEAEGAAR